MCWTISCWRAPAATNCAATVKDLGVVFVFWNEPVSVVMPVRSNVAISASIKDGVFPPSAGLPSVASDSKSETRISAVLVAVRSIQLTLPK